jgi:hypothetical protein
MDETVRRRDTSPTPRRNETLATRLAQLVLSASCYVALGLRYDVHITGLEHYHRASSELLISAHKRDPDPLVSASFLVRLPARIFDRRPIVNVMREDGMRAGFLSTVVGYKRWPEPIQRALYAVNLGPILRLFGAKPVVRVQEYTLEDQFRDLLDDGENPRLDALLEEPALAEFSALGRLPAAELTVREALDWRYRPILRRLVQDMPLLPAQRTALNRRRRERVFRQLDTLAALVQSGATMWFAPEGEVSLDGRICHIRDGLYYIVRKAPADILCLPMNLVYEFMTASRPALFVVIGPHLPGLTEMKRPMLAQQVRRALASLVMVTVQHLGSRALLAAAETGEHAFNQCVWESEMRRAGARLCELGAHMDPRIFDGAALHTRVRDYLRYCERLGLVKAAGHGWYTLNGARILANEATTFWDNPVRYCANELADLEEALTGAPTALAEAADAL